MRYVFAGCELDTDLFMLYRQGHATRLRPKVFQVLLYLIEHRDGVISKDTLIETVWPDQYISEATLADAIRDIRRVVGDRPRHPHVIQTRHGHGYHFIAEVKAVAESPSEWQSQGVPSPPSSPLTPDLTPPHNASHVNGERKIVTVIYGSLGNSVTLSEQLDLDALHTLMQTRYRLINESVEPYEGTVQALPGDRVLVVFGVPITHEDHARRAAVAALTIRQRLEAHCQTLSATYQAALAVRLGIHTGWVAVSGVEETSERSPMVIGEAVALAITLQEHAEAGMILCSEATARLLREAAQVEKHFSLSLPEHPVPIVVYTLESEQRLSRPRVRQRRLSPFVGRAREMATLQALLEQVHEGQGHVVAIVGDPGIGKSRLLVEFRRNLRRASVTYLQSQCLSYGVTSPYLPVRQLLRQMCAITDADPPEVMATKVRQRLQEAQMPAEAWAPHLLHLLGIASPTLPMPALRPQEHKERTFTALLQLCISLSHQGPLVLEIENLHWIDATSEEWLASLVARISSGPILVLGSFRPGYRPIWLGASYATQLSLSRLAAHESLQMLQAMPQVAQMSERLTRELLTKADGNPFFLEELSRAVAVDNLGQMLAIPDTVQAVLAARIDRLPATEKHLVQVAAVIGKDVALPLLEQVADLPAPVLQQALQRLQTAELFYETSLIPTPAYTFKHALTQEVAYQSLLASARRPYHQKVAQCLVTHFPEMAAMQPEWVAHHYSEAELLDEALPYWQRAGEQAVARSSNVEAISHFTQGLEVLSGLPLNQVRNQHELELQRALSTPLFLTRQTQAMGQASQRILELSQGLEDTAQYFLGLVGLWRSLFNTGQLQQAQEVGQKCLALAEKAQDPDSLVEVHMMLGSTKLGLGHLIPAHEHFQHSISVYDAQSAPAQNLRLIDPGVVSLCREAWSLSLMGFADQALDTNNRALTIAHAITHPFSLVFAMFQAGITHLCRRELDTAIQYADAVISIANEHELVYHISGGECFKTLLLAELEAPDIDLSHLCETVVSWKDQETMFGLSALYVTFANVYLQCGAVETGLQTIDDAFAVIQTREERFYEAEAYRLRGELLLHASLEDIEQAEASFQQARDIAVRQHAKAWELRATTSLCRLWRRQGRHQAARLLLEPLYNWFTEGLTTLDLLEARELLDDLIAS